MHAAFEGAQEMPSGVPRNDVRVLLRRDIQHGGLVIDRANRENVDVLNRSGAGELAEQDADVTAHVVVAQRFRARDGWPVHSGRSLLSAPRTRPSLDGAAAAVLEHPNYRVPLLFLCAPGIAGIAAPLCLRRRGLPRTIAP